MPQDDFTGQEPLGFRQRDTLTFLLKEIQRRFPDRTRREVHDALEHALTEIAPSRNRNRLRKRMIDFLTGKP